MRLILDGDGVTRIRSPLGGEYGGPTWGWAWFDYKNNRLAVCFSDGSDTGWDHVSVSKKLRCPYWEEMDAVKRRFFKPDELVMQLHMPVGENRSLHNFCLHLWRPVNDTIPQPPPELVGDVGLASVR